jgi:hypothetical protein
VQPDFTTERAPHTFTTPAGALYQFYVQNVAEMTDITAIAADHATQLQLAKRY